MTKKSESVPVHCERCEAHLGDYAEGPAWADRILVQPSWAAHLCKGKWERSTPVSRAEYLMRIGHHLFWCRECSGEPPEHIKNYEHYGEATCGECFFRFRK